MIVFGGNKFIPFLIEDSTYLAPKWYKLNFYNTYNIGYPINNMYPPIQLQEFYFNKSIDQSTFNYQFMKFILENDNAFISFLNILMAQYYHGDTFVLFDDDNEFIVNLVETIIELIYQRYGYTCSVVNEPYDIQWIDNDFKMSIEGNNNFNIDKERFTYLTFKNGA